MKTKHTPGPWKHSLKDRIWKVDSNGGNVCIIAHEDSPNRDKEANARLIAAAPEMYTLVNALANMVALSDHSPEEFKRAALAMGEAAVRIRDKATGDE